MCLVAAEITVIEIKSHTKQNRKLLHKNGPNDTANAKLISNAGSNKMFIRIAYVLISVLKNVKIFFLLKNTSKLLKSLMMEGMPIFINTTKSDTTIGSLSYAV